MAPYKYVYKEKRPIGLSVKNLFWGKQRDRRYSCISLPFQSTGITGKKKDNNNNPLYIGSECPGSQSWQLDKHLGLISSKGSWQREGSAGGRREMAVKSDAQGKSYMTNHQPCIICIPLDLESQTQLLKIYGQFTSMYKSL